MFVVVGAVVDVCGGEVVIVVGSSELVMVPVACAGLEGISVTTGLIRTVVVDTRTPVKLANSRSQRTGETYIQHPHIDTPECNIRHLD